MKKIQVNINGRTYQFELRQENDRLFIRQNGDEYSADLVRLSSNRYSLIVGGHSHEIGAVPSDGGYAISSGSRSAEFLVEDYEIARLKKAAGIDDRARSKNIAAPMPGLIVRLNFEPGDEVKKGDALLVMEAMKMENDIKSPLAGKVKSISVTVGESVDKGQTLVEFE
jgi:biotin carboxyl carrier protein